MSWRPIAPSASSAILTAGFDSSRPALKTVCSEPPGFRPYPEKYVTTAVTRDGVPVTLRPIRPEDEPLWLEMFRNFSERTVRNRFFQLIKDTPHETRIHGLEC